MQFDMTKTPPTQQEIDQERDALEKKIKGLRLALFGCGVLPGALVAALVWFGEVAHFGYAVIFGGVISIITGVSLCKIAHRLTTYRSTIALLAPLPDESEECVSLVAACRADAQCDAYRQAVMQQGRSLVMEEVEALIRWKETRRERETEAEAHRQRQEACAVLHSTEKLA